METFLIDYAPLVEYVTGILFAVLIAVGAWAAKKIGDKFGLEADSQLRYLVNEAIFNAISFAEQRLAESGRKYTRETEREFVANIVNYVINAIPETLAHFGIDEQRLVEMVESRLNHVEYDDEDSDGTA